MKSLAVLALALVAAHPLLCAAGPSTPGPYRVLTSARVGGAGGFDYVTADAANRRLYIPRGDRVDVFDLDTLTPAGCVPGAKSVHGVAVDLASGRAYSSSKPVLAWDARTLAPMKSIDVSGRPDGIFWDAASGRVFVLSHQAPSVTVLNGADGSVAGTIDLDAAPEQGVCDGRGRVYIDLEDKDQVAVVDAKTLKVVSRYGLGGRGGVPAGLAIDAAHHVLFVCCRKPQVCVILDADDGRIVTALPLGAGTDGALFNPATQEAFSSNYDGTLTVIRENSPTDFVVEQTVATRPGARTCTLDSRTGRVFLVTAEYAPAPPGQQGPGRPRLQMVPGSFAILAVGR